MEEEQGGSPRLHRVQEQRQRVRVGDYWLTLFSGQQTDILNDRETDGQMDGQMD